MEVLVLLPLGVHTEVHHCRVFHTGIPTDSEKDIWDKRSGSVGGRRVSCVLFGVHHIRCVHTKQCPGDVRIRILLTLAWRNDIVAADELVLLRESLVLVAWVGEDCVVVLGVCDCWSHGLLRSGYKLARYHLPVNNVHVLSHELFRVPLGVPSGAVCFEVVLSWPPLHFAIRTRDTDEPFQSALGWGFVVSSRFVVAVPIIFRRKANILCHAFGVTALEGFGVFPLVFSEGSQHQEFATSKGAELTPDPSGSWARICGRFHIRAAAGWIVCVFHWEQVLGRPISVSLVEVALLWVRAKLQRPRNILSDRPVRDPVCTPPVRTSRIQNPVAKPGRFLSCWTSHRFEMAQSSLRSSWHIHCAGIHRPGCCYERTEAAAILLQPASLGFALPVFPQPLDLWKMVRDQGVVAQSSATG